MSEQLERMMESKPVVRIRTQYYGAEGGAGKIRARHQDIRVIQRADLELGVVERHAVVAGAVMAKLEERTGWKYSVIARHAADGYRGGYVFCLKLES